MMLPGDLDTSTGNSTLDAIAAMSGAGTRGLVMEWIILLSIAGAFTILRFIARSRVVGWRRLTWDDYLVLVAVLFYGALVADVYMIAITAEGLSNDNLSGERRAELGREGTDSLEFRLRVFGSKIQIAKWMVYSLVLWLLKGSLLHFFVRLTEGVPSAKSRAWASGGILFLAWAATVVSVFTTCRPLKGYWQIFPDPGIMCYPSISPILITVFLSCNVLTDLYLVSIPVPVLLRAPLRKSQKFSFICLFSCNILITGMAIVRAVLLITDPMTNANGMWAVRETFLAIITTNLPPIAPLIRSCLSPCMGRMDSSDYDDNENDDKKQQKQQPDANRFSRRPSTAGKVGEIVKRSTSGLGLNSSNNNNRHLSRYQVRHSETLHNQAMKEQYFSGIWTDEDNDDDDDGKGNDMIKMRAYRKGSAASSGSGNSTVDDKGAPPPPPPPKLDPVLEKPLPPPRFEDVDPVSPALVIQRNVATPVARHRRDDEQEEETAQTVRYLV